MRAFAALLLLALASTASANLCDVKAMETSPVIVEIGSVSNTGSAELVVLMPLEVVSSSSKYLKSVAVDFSDGATGVCASLDLDNAAFGLSSAAEDLGQAPTGSVAKALWFSSDATFSNVNGYTVARLESLDAGFPAGFPSCEVVKLTKSIVIDNLVSDGCLIYGSTVSEKLQYNGKVKVTRKYSITHTTPAPGDLPASEVTTERVIDDNFSVRISVNQKSTATGTAGGVDVIVRAEVIDYNVRSVVKSWSFTPTGSGLSGDVEVVLDVPVNYPFKIVTSPNVIAAPDTNCGAANDEFGQFCLQTITVKKTDVTACTVGSPITIQSIDYACRSDASLNGDCPAATPTGTTGTAQTPAFSIKLASTTCGAEVNNEDYTADLSASLTFVEGLLKSSTFSTTPQTLFFYSSTAPNDVMYVVVDIDHDTSIDGATSIVSAEVKETKATMIISGNPVERTETTGIVTAAQQNGGICGRISSTEYQACVSVPLPSAMATVNGNDKMDMNVQVKVEVTLQDGQGSTVKRSTKTAVLNVKGKAQVLPNSSSASNVAGNGASSSVIIAVAVVVAVAAVAVIAGAVVLAITLKRKAAAASATA